MQQGPPPFSPTAPPGWGTSARANGFRSGMHGTLRPLASTIREREQASMLKRRAADESTTHLFLAFTSSRATGVTEVPTAAPAFRPGRCPPRTPVLPPLSFSRVPCFVPFMLPVWPLPRFALLPFFRFFLPRPPAWGCEKPCHVGDELKTISKSV